MGKNSKEKLSNFLITLVVGLILLLLGDIWATVKDTRIFQIEDTKRITKLETNVDNLKADVINLEDRVDKIDDAVFHVQ